MGGSEGGDHGGLNDVKRCALRIVSLFFKFGEAGASLEENLRGVCAAAVSIREVRCQ